MLYGFVSGNWESPDLTASNTVGFLVTVSGNLEIDDDEYNNNNNKVTAISPPSRTLQSDCYYAYNLG